MLEYELKAPLDLKARQYIVSAVERTFRTHRIEIGKDVITAEFDEEVSDETFTDLMDRLVYVARRIETDVLFVQEREPKYTQNPMAALRASEEVVKIGDGMFLFQGGFLAVLRGLERIVDRLAQKRGALEQQGPVLWPFELYRRIRYLEEFPHEVLLASGVKEGFEARRDFATKYGQDCPEEAVSASDLSDSTFGLQPSVCNYCYYALRGVRDFSDTVYTTRNKVFRNEKSNIDGLDRLVNFTVQDIMYVGSPDFVKAMGLKLANDCAELLGILGLDSRIETADDPFFTNETAVKSVFQYAARLKYELLASLPFLGQDLAVGSINDHRDFFGKAFDIRLTDGEVAHSGCTGFGFERLAFALYCQFGPVVSDWPPSVGAALAENP